jgi:ribose transport system permease protein
MEQTMFKIPQNMDWVKIPARWIKHTPAFLFLVLFLFLSFFFVPRFSRPANIFNIVVQASDLIILACGMTYVFINGSIDFSITAVLPLASILGAAVMKAGGGPEFIPLAIAVMLLTGIVLGSVNGLAVTVFRMPSFIATMAVQLIFAGLALTITESKSIGGLPPAFSWIARGSLFFIPVPILITLIVVFVSWFVLFKTVYGRRLVAVGINQRTAFVSGVHVKKTVFSLFVYSGFLSAIASVIMSSRLGAGVPALGKDMLMDVVGAVVVGGTSVSGGKGNLTGTVIAALFIVTLNNSLNLLKLDWYLINVCKGLFILLVALYGTLSEKTA